MIASSLFQIFNKYIVCPKHAVRTQLIDSLQTDL